MALPAHDLYLQALAVAGQDAIAFIPPDASPVQQPAYVITPPDVAALCRTVSWAYGNGVTLMPRGGGTKLGWMAGHKPADLVLSTARLNRVIEHQHGDLTARIEAGATLTAVNAQLGRHRQWLPLDPPWSDRATIGGILATNDSGPRRHGFGAPRDLVIGVEFVRSDGTLAKAGGNVVKNVAGYDLGRLLTGSFGTLAIIVSATFKLLPMQPASRTVVVDLQDLDHLGPAIRLVTASTLAPSAFELQLPPMRVLVRFETLPDVADRQAADAVAMVKEHGMTAHVVQDDEERELWAAHMARPWDEEGVVLKVGILPSDIAQLLVSIQSSMRLHRVEGEVMGRAGAGVLLLRLKGKAEDLARMIQEIRQRFQPGAGYATVLRGAGTLREHVDFTGSLGEEQGLGVMRAVKQQFDPRGVLNPGGAPWDLAIG